MIMMMMMMKKKCRCVEWTWLNPPAGAEFCAVTKRRKPRSCSCERLANTLRNMAGVGELFAKSAKHGLKV
jgi:hypothetical protein